MLIAANVFACSPTALIATVPQWRATKQRWTESSCRCRQRKHPEQLQVSTRKKKKKSACSLPATLAQWIWTTSTHYESFIGLIPSYHSSIPMKAQCENAFVPRTGCLFKEHWKAHFLTFHIIFHCLWPLSSPHTCFGCLSVNWNWPLGVSYDRYCWPL